MGMACGATTTDICSCDGVGNRLSSPGLSPTTTIRFRHEDLEGFAARYDTCGTNSFCRNKLGSRGSNSSGVNSVTLVAVIILLACFGLAGCGGTSSSASSGEGAAPTITSFAANPTSINSGASSTLNWVATGATSIAIMPGTFTSTSASGSTSMSPMATTTYTLTATNAAGSATSTLTITVNAGSYKPTISSFTANPTGITSGFSSMLSWVTTGATSIAITPGTFTSTSANGATSISPTATTTYTLTATNAAGSSTSTATVTVTAPGGALAIVTTSCPDGTQGSAYAGCTIVAAGGSPPYTYSVSTNASFPPLPEGMSLNAATGSISSALIGGQGTYTPQFVVTDSASNQATQNISFAINGNNAFLATIFPSTSIFHHRVDAATTNLPVDTSPAAPMYPGLFVSDS